MRAVVGADQMREAERLALAAQEGLPAGSPDTLMGRAAAAVADVALSMAGGGRVLVVAGPGNNGADGLFAAAELARTLEVQVWLSGDGVHEAAWRAAVSAGCREVEAADAVAALPDVSIVIDAVAGLGGRPGLPDDVAVFAEACRALAVPVLAVDLPSGLAADGSSGGVSFRADVTVTFAAAKPCHVLAPASLRCGRLVVADIGLQGLSSRMHLMEESDLARWWPVPGPESHKYSRGVVGLDTGSQDYPGAALLGCSGALHAGAGMVRYVGPASRDLVLGRFPSVVCGDGRVQALVVGSGWGEADGVARFRAALERGVPLVVDADALRLLPAELPEGSVLTPHAGELARLLAVEREAVEADPVVHARRAAQQFGATVLLKGGLQPVANPDGSVLLAVAGPGWTAQAGSGDTLAGAVGTLVAAGLAPQRAAAMAASLQAVTATRNPGPLTPDELASRFPPTIGAFLHLLAE